MTLCLLAVGTAAEPEAAVLTPAQARPFGSVARGLAKGGHDEGLELARLVAAVGPAKGGARLVADCEKALGKAKKKAKLTASTTRAVARAVRGVERLLDKTEDASVRRRLAEFVLGVDARSEAAHKALGHERHDGGWHDPATIPLLKRRAAIADILRRARRLPVEIEEAKSEIEMIEAVHGRPGVRLSWRAMHMHSADVPPAKMRRMLTSLVQATAVWNWLLNGTFEPKASRVDWVVTATKPVFARWKRTSLERHLLDQAKFDWIKDFDWFHILTYTVLGPSTEADTEAILLYDVTSRDMPDGWNVSLCAGQLNYVCFEFLGVSMPRLFDQSTTTRVERKTQSTPRTTIERKKHEAMAGAQLTGMKRWLAYLAKRGEDPPWWTTLHGRLADFARDELLKATIVASYFNERDEFRDLWQRGRGLGRTPRDNKDPMAGTLGRTHLAFEAEWRAWLLAAPSRGILQRLGGTAGDGKRAPVLAYLDALRLRAIPGAGDDWLTPLELDPELSDGCRRHAEYLHQNPEQQSQWPQAHEEFAGKPGYSVEGLRAGLNSVIAFAQKDATVAVDEWLATYYHRLPLLDPGVLRIGWGLHEGVAVLDCTSLVDPDALVAIACWPPPGETNVRRSFAPELPNPIPGADQSQWGYPVTLQAFGEPGEHAPGLVLHEGKAGGPVVACLTPTNPELTPRDTFCLIPQQTLKAKTRYVVTGTHPQTGKPLAWTFTTGS